MATTLAQLRVQVAAKLGLDDSSGSADRTLMALWANQGYLDILSRTKCYVTSGTISLAANDTDKTLSSSYLAVTELFAPSSSDSTAYRRMQRVTAAELLEYRLGVSVAANTPLYYATQGANLLMVYPSPATSMTLTVYYVPAPTALSGDSDVPDKIPAEYQKLVEYYMLWQGGQYANDAPSKDGQLFKDEYEDELVKFERAVRDYGGRVLAPTPIGRRRKHILQPGQDDGT